MSDHTDTRRLTDDPHPRSAIVALAIALPLSLAACGGSAESDRRRGADGPQQLEPRAPSPEQHDLLRGHGRHGSRAFGAGCAAVPKDGKGSFAGMATDPVATAASNNPLLSTLVTAVDEAGLGRHPELGPGHHRLRADQRRVRQGPGGHPRGPWPTQGPADQGPHQPRRRRQADPGRARGRPQDAGRHARSPSRAPARTSPSGEAQGHLRQRADRQRDRLHHRRRAPAPARARRSVDHGRHVSALPGTPSPGESAAPRQPDLSELLLRASARATRRRSPSSTTRVAPALRPRAARRA